MAHCFLFLTPLKLIIITQGMWQQPTPSIKQNLLGDFAALQNERFHHRFVPFPCMGSFTSLGIDTR